MNYKGLFKSVLGLALILALGTYMTSCGEDTPPQPTLKLVVNGIDGFTVDIAAEATNATTWAWDYGDGNVSDTIGGHFYTYDDRGDFTIKCTVTGDGGSATQTVDVHVATIEELLTAHTWVMSNAGNNGLGFHITPELTLDFPVNDVLATIDGLQDDGNDVPYNFPDEYEDEYTFNSDGSYTVDYKNDNVLTSWVYAPADKIVGTCVYVGMFAISQNPLQNATWTLHENETLTLNTVYDADGDNSGGVAETVNFNNVDYVTFENGGFLGIKDYTSTFIIRSIKPDELAVTVFFHGYYDGTLGLNKPSYIINLTFKAK